MNANLKINGEKIQMPTTAKLVSYGDTNVEDALNDLNGEEIEMSTFGRQLYEADEREFYRLLKISKETFWDEGQTRFKATGGAILLASQAKVGEKSLSLTADRTLRSAAPIEFGGDPFEISFYAKISPVVGNSIFRALGTKYSFGLMRSLQYGVTEQIAVKSVVYASGTTSAVVSESSPYWTYGAENTWTLIKLTYNGSGSLRIYQGSTLKKTVSKTIPREPRRLFLGACAGYFDEFKLIDDGVTKVHLTFE